MRTIGIIVFMILISSCTKKIEVTSIDQIPGKWSWESTCGGNLDTCLYSSKEHYATLEFTNNGTFIEKHNDSVYFQSNYAVTKFDDVFGTLILNNGNLSLPVTILNNRLIISRGDQQSSYSKIK